MTNELEPLKECPFCGGEDGKHSEDCYIIMSQENVSFINLHHKPMYTSEELREAYNTRYKRTVRLSQNTLRDDEESKRCNYHDCPDCGHLICPTFDKHCAGCGAEVVDGD